jgi:hypothetical protein
MRLCAELADLAMQLARAAAARTLTNWAESEPPAPSTEATQTPSSPAASPNAAAETAPPKNATPKNATPAPQRQAGRSGCQSYKPIDPALLFTRLAAIVRDCIAIETRLAASAPQPASIPHTPQQPADAQHRAPREAPAPIRNNNPNRVTLLSQTSAHLDQERPKNPTPPLELSDLLAALCQQQGITLNGSKRQPEFLVTAHATYPP